MAHQSYYRKYRPTTFDEVVGQQHVERTLRNAIAEEKVGHAYLFTGPRGTGKTTTARLLAKALLCERAPSQEPDGTCQECLDVAEGRHPDVREIDAASNTGVDAIREEVITRVQYAPTRGRYKIYIVDEVHMLSSSAFNALLKTLEEPPERVVFILCTTHPQKVPDTILSRCQRFDFRRISVEEVADHLRFIAEAEGLVVDKGAFGLIAKHADGGMRDAITSLEQLASFTGGEISVDDVEGLLGEVDSAQLFAIAGFVARRDIAGCFRWVADLVETGADLAEVVKELTAHVRDLYVLAVLDDVSGVVDRSGDELSLLASQVTEFGGPDRLAHLLDLLGELAAETRWSSDPRLSMEVALTRMARPHGELTLSALAERVEMLERGVTLADEHGAPSHAVPPASDQAPAATTSAPEPPAPVTKPVPKPGSIDRGTAKRSWQAVVLEIKKMRPARAHMFSTVEVDVDADGKTLVLEFPGDQSFSLGIAEDPETKDVLKQALAAVFGYAPPFRYQLGRGPVRPVEEPVHAVEANRTDVSPEDTCLGGSGAEADAVRVAHSVGIDEPSIAHEQADPATGDLQSLLFDQLGATVVAEHAASEDGEDE